MKVLTKKTSANGRVKPSVHLQDEAQVSVNGSVKPSLALSDICAELRALQRQRSIVIKSRNMQANRIQAIVAGTLGYESRMPEKERAKKFIEASALIKAISEDEDDPPSPLREIVKVTLIGIDAFNQKKAELESEMRKWSKQLPVSKWIEKKEQAGISVDYLGVIIGETGDLNLYANPAKVWRRLGCAPWQFDGKTQMGATWRSGKNGKLPASEWEDFGYSPRRRSISFLIGEGIVKQNHASYRQRYDETKAKLKADHPDYSDLRCHRHGMLLATKLFLKNLWIEWRE